MSHDEKPLNHVCIYLPEGELHLNVFVQDGATISPEDLADAVADAVYSGILSFYEEVSAHANSGSISLQ